MPVFGFVAEGTGSPREFSPGASEDDLSWGSWDADGVGATYRRRGRGRWASFGRARAVADPGTWSGTSSRRVSWGRSGLHGDGRERWRQGCIPASSHWSPRPLRRRLGTLVGASIRGGRDDRAGRDGGPRGGQYDAFGVDGDLGVGIDRGGQLQAFAEFAPEVVEAVVAAPELAV